MKNIQPKYLFILALHFVFLSGLAQDYKDNSWIFKVDGPQLIDAFSFPTLPIAVEKRLTSRISVIAEAGYQLYNFYPADTAYIKTSGYKLSLEVRRYFGKSDKVRKKPYQPGLFLGLQFFYRQNQSVGLLRYRDFDNPNGTINDEFTVYKKIGGCNLTAGYQFAFLKTNKKWFVEPHIGLGIMHRDIRNGELQYNYETHIIEDESVVPEKNPNLVESNGIKFNLNFGCRLGLSFNKK